MSRERDDDATEILAGDTQGTIPAAGYQDATVLNRSSGVGRTLTGYSGIGNGRQSQENAERRRGRSPWWALVPVLVFVLAALYFFPVWMSWPGRQADPDPSGSVYRDSLILVETSLAADDVGTLVAQLWSIAQTHPQNLEMGRLLEDATRYELMLHSVRQGRLIDLAGQRRDRPLATGVFEGAAVVNIDPLLPGPEFIEAMQKAREQWRQGELVDALIQLRALAQTDDRNLAAQWLERYAALIDSYDALNRLKANPVYPVALVNFYLSLDPLQDPFFLQRVDADIDAVQTALEQGTTQRLRGSVRQWLNYHRHGGIDGSLRRNPQTGLRFQQRAQELADAFNDLSVVLASQAGDGLSATVGELQFPVQLRSEISHQRGRLAALLVYNKQPVLETRLTMLPLVDISGTAAP